MIKRIAVSGLVFCASLLAACSSGTGDLPAAPLGDQAVLQKLADSWEEISEAKMNMSPAILPADKRRHFLGEVFMEAGYDYSKTLHEMALKGIDKSNKLHKDMTELVLMPHRNQRGGNMDPAEIYSMEELKSVAAIERALKQ